MPNSIIGTPASRKPTTVKDVIQTPEFSQKYVVDNLTNTFKQIPKNDPKDRIEIELGDVHEQDFMPQLKIKRWDNEVNFSIRYKDNEPEVKPKLKTEGKKLKYEKSNYDIEFYDYDDTEFGHVLKENIEIDDEGNVIQRDPEVVAMEFEVILKDRPSSNILEFSIETKGLAFYFQDSLSDEEILSGAFRPENVVGSYAVYHDSKMHNNIFGKNYKVGKAFHIYRPQIIDSEGSKVWGILDVNVSSKTLTIEVPQEFLDKAVYPVYVDPTFGYTSVGASYANTLDDYTGTLSTLSENAVISSVHAYLDTGGAYTAGAVYSSGKILQEQSWEFSPMSGYSGWRPYPMQDLLELSSGDFYGMVYYEYTGTGNPSKAYYDTVTDSGVEFYDSNDDAAAMTSDLSGYSASYTNRKFSIYVSYELPTSTILHVGTSQNSGSSAAISVDKMAGLEVGDAVVLWTNANGPKDVTDNNGSAPFTSVLSNREFNGPSAQLDCFVRVIDGTEGSTFDFTMSGSDRWAVIAKAYRNVNTSTLWNIQPTSSTENTGTGSTQTTQSITTTTDGAKVVIVIGADSNSLFMEEQPSGYNVWGHSKGQQLLALMDIDKATAGAVSSQSITMNSSSGTWINNIFALEPAAGGTAYTKDVSDNLVLSGSLILDVSKTLQDNLVKTGFLISNTTKSLSENLSLAGSLDFLLSKLKSFSENLSLSSALSNLTSKTFQGIISLTEAFSKTYSEFYLNDITSNNNDLINVGASPYVTDTPFSQSSIAGDFDAANSEYAYISDANQSGLDIVGDFTLEAWIKLDQLPSTAGHDFQIISKTDIGVTGGYSLTIRSATNQLRATFSDGVNSTRVDMNEAFDSGDIGNWIHVVVVVDVSVPSMTFYKNASVAASTAAATDATSVDSGSSDFMVGAVKVSGTPDRFFDGKIDEVRVWNDIRTSTEISDNYNIELEGTESGLVAYYPFESTLGILTLVLSDTLVLTSSLIKSISKSLLDTVVAVSALIKSFARSISNTLSLSESLTNAPTIGLALSDTLSLSESYSSNVALVKSLSDALDLVSNIEASLAVSLSDGLILSSLLTFSGYVSKTLTIIYNILAFVTGYRSKPIISAAQDEKPEIENAGTDRPVVFFAEDQ